MRDLVLKLSSEVLVLGLEGRLVKFNSLFSFLMPKANYSKGLVKKKKNSVPAFHFGDATFSLCLIIENEWSHHICSQSRQPLRGMA